MGAPVSGCLGCGYSDGGGGGGRSSGRANSISKSSYSIATSRYRSLGGEGRRGRHHERASSRGRGGRGGCRPRNGAGRGDYRLLLLAQGELARIANELLIQHHPRGPC